MNYYKARELRDANGNGTGRWHYTCMNDGWIWPVGHCSPITECPTCNGNSMFRSDQICETCQNKGTIRVENPCAGHATEEEANKHYKQYLLDKANLSGPKTTEWPKNKCSVEGCSHEATHLGNIDWSRCFELCDEHANKETLATLFEVGECWSS